MEMFFPQVFERLMTDGGLAAALLAIAVIYQTRQLGKERAKNDGLNGQILRLSTAQIAAMKEVQNVLEKVVDLTPSLRS